MVKTKNVSTNYTPRPLQAELHRKLKRFNVLVLHRRAGKTVFSINEMVDKGLHNPLRNPQYAYVAPTYKQAKMIAWDYFRYHTQEIPGQEENKSELTVFINRPAPLNDRIKFILLGADNPDSLRGIYLDGAVLDEFAQCDPIIWGEILRPALSDRIGWAIFIGTPKGKNHFYDRYKKALEQKSWYVKVVKADVSGIIPKVELEEMKADMDVEEYAQEMLCDWTAAVLGSYYGHIIVKLREEGRITKVGYDPSFPVDTFWDLGIGDSTSIWFRQKVGPNWNYIDYYEMSGEGIKHYVKYLKEKPYVYGRHVLPHDAAARDFSTGQTRQQMFTKLGIRTEIQPRQSVDDGIQAARAILPNCVFDAEKCERGLEALENYQKEWDTKLMMFKNKPKHDWACHGSDAFKYSALDRRNSTFGDSWNDELPSFVLDEYDELEA